MTTKVFLVGYMGCGKSTLARKLSRRTGVRAVDTDAEVERMEGASVGDIFRYEGEERFRELERSVVERVAASGEACIVATGGGLPTWSDNMEMLSKAGTTVYLRRSAERIAARLTPYGRAKRPKLQGLGDAELVEFHAAQHRRARTLLRAGGARARLRHAERRGGRGTDHTLSRRE